ncbi:phasin family protein [Erythrobacter sanguineus]|uniref:Phasin family protein n=1 Tax=Erythrobacter sanguineus TaxID=198312 RepID=A0A1M7SNP5_9SPHN|nr:phasin family protein [Erythrobacter sanguineus]SHN60083.1 phasin family protein [Erythrobacter sanguineus]
MSEVENTAVEAKNAPKPVVAKIDAAAEKAYAEASAKLADAPKAEKAAPKALSATTPASKAAAPKKPVAKPAAKKPATRKVAVKKPAVKKTPAKTVAVKKTAAPKKPAPVKKAAKAPAAPAINPVIKLKDTIMATAKNTDITATAKEMLADVQTRTKTAATTAYAKTAELAGEAGEFSKANVEAVVESGKIFFAGAQDIVRSDLETGKSVIETVTEDAKKVAAIKSPTELMQLQGEIARRNFDAVVSFGSKRTEAWVKLYNDAFAPISNRVSVAAEKISKAA